LITTVTVGGPRKPDAKSLPDAHPLPHQDEASPCSKSDIDEEEEPSDDGTRDQGSNYGETRNRNQQEMIDRRAADFGSGSNSNGYDNESQNKISDAALEFQNRYSDTASGLQAQCLATDLRYRDPCLDATARSNFVASDSIFLTSLNTDLVSAFNLPLLFNSNFKMLITVPVTGVDNPDGEKTGLAKCLLRDNELFSNNIRKPIIISGFYHKYVRMKFLSHAACLLLMKDVCFWLISQ
jgi:hypothetical protein